VPTYSYACTECGNRFDMVQAFTDDALTSCPQCSGRLRKLFGSVGVVFKGSGFYRTDSREAAKASNGSGKHSGSESSESSGSSGSSGTGDNSGLTEKTAKSAPSGDKSGDGSKSGTSSTKAAASAG
jgi:putative FmdB family regulatory protein